MECHNPAIQALADAAEQFCARWYRNQPKPGLLVMSGNPNCGKTHVAKHIYVWCRQAAFRAHEAGAGKTWKGNIPSVSFYSWPEMTDDFKQGNYGSVEDMMSADLLVLDDIGAEHDPSKSATNKLCQILSRRENNFTVVTTNVPFDKWAEVFDARIADRLIRNSDVVDLFQLPSFALVRE